eukprot:6854978-Prorocentrum_lima.AAC.1
MRMRNIRPLFAIMIRLTSVHIFVKPISKRNVVGVNLQDDQHHVDASSTGVNPTIAGSLHL